MKKLFKVPVFSLSLPVWDPELGSFPAWVLELFARWRSGASADEVLGEAEEARGLCQEAENVIGEAAALKVMVDCYVAKQDYQATSSGIWA